jgi:hypothetical protein
VRRELGNFVAQAIELSGRGIGIDHGGHQHVHGESPIEETLHGDFGPTCVARREAIAMLSPHFVWARADAHLEPSEARQRGVYSAACRHRICAAEVGQAWKFRYTEPS